MGLEIKGKEKAISWGEFESEVDLLKKIVTKTVKEEPDQYVQEWLFRGQSDSQWGLKTSLERYLFPQKQPENIEIDVGVYFQQVRSIIPALNSLTGRKYERTILAPDSRNTGWSLSTLELLYYLRHHGFPTPLLDWSRSYLVAAFFAFQSARDDCDVAIYAYNETLIKSRGGWVGEAQINTLGPYVETHRRHYLQQSEYTVCMSEKGRNSEKTISFRNHEDAVKENPADHPMVKYIIDGKEKNSVLKKLDEANINAYTLFGSEESLMNMLAFREIASRRDYFSLEIE
ncbi:FRG domain-containing protein [Pleomorphomonas sp. JP5]|uniref:FRG domain-containing protein n=1 Tax=Pleomorphomonas sp. JP5 TaxID=2942998 RepID=UPI0020435F9F|nr:FRG domain-containing protein [Pleomorphomonas sp. JP5]MCM5557296.1 FRG domain-containing protein [Pleomorphomonas sp. JP5]